MFLRAFFNPKKNAHIVENGDFTDHDSLVDYFENPDNKNETFDA